MENGCEKCIFKWKVEGGSLYVAIEVLCATYVSDICMMAKESNLWVVASIESMVHLISLGFVVAYVDA